MRGVQLNTEAVFSFINKYNMLPEGAAVLCAVSGGADSVCMLHLLCSRPGLRVVCAHFNHHIRGGEAERDAEFVRELAVRLGAEYIRGDGDVPAYAALHGMGIEEAAREMRYAFLNKAAAEHGCAVIAAAHNANDNAETVLMNLARGTGLQGLCGIPPVRDKIIRPLLGTTRAEIEEYLAENGLGHVEDSTNASDEYTRNRLRHHALPLLEEINSGAVENILRACESLREDERFLTGEALRFVNEHCENGRVDIELLLSLPRPVLMRVFRQLCGLSLEEKHTRALERLCRSEARHAFADVPGMRVELERGTLIFGAARRGKLPELSLEPGDEKLLPEAKMRVSCKFTEDFEEVNNSFNTFCFKSESICGRISLAPRKPGDSIRLLGRGCTKSLKKLFNESTIPLSDRELIPVLRDEKGVIAVYGFGIDERCRALPGDKTVKIEFFGEDGSKSYER